MATSRQREEREERHADTARRLDEHGRGWTPTSFTIPEGWEMFRFKEERVYSIDIVPYTVGTNNPYAKEGEKYFERTFYVHRNVGPSQETHCCPLKCFGKKCPMCEERNTIPFGKDKDRWKVLKEQERQLFVFRLNDEGGKLALFESSFNMGFGELLDNKLKLARAKMQKTGKRDPRLDFWHAKGGMTLEVNVEEESWTSTDGRSGKTMRPNDLDFAAREEALDPKALKGIPCLDDLLVEVSFTKLQALYKGLDDGESNGEAPPDFGRAVTKGKKSPPPPDDDDDEDGTDDEDDDGDDGDGDGEQTTIAASNKPNVKKGDMVTHDEHGECKVVHVSADGTTCKLEDEEGDVHTGIDVDDLVFRKLTTKTAPKSAPAKAKKPPVEEEEEEDEEEDEDSEGGDEDEEDLDDDEDEEEEAPPPKAKGKKK